MTDCVIINMKTYTPNELEEWCRKAFDSGYSEGLSDGHPMSRCRGTNEAFKTSGIKWDLEEELLTIN